MNATAVDLRRQRGIALAVGSKTHFRLIAGSTYLVPSATNSASGYVVDLASGRCSCPDFEERGLPCKHLWALRYHRQETDFPDGSTVVTETMRITYPQDWPAYNRAQVEEKERVQVLLAGLLDGVVQPPQRRGRPRLPLRDVIYGAAMKVYSTMSGRRASTDIRECEVKGLVDHAPAYNSVFRYLERPELTPLLKKLVEESATPLRAIETSFAVDATGFATNTYARWFDHKYGGERRCQRWIKCHAMVGTTTNVITAVEVTDGYANDSPLLVPLFGTTVARGFAVSEVSADKAYLGNDNLTAIEAAGAVPYVPFKSNSSPTGGSDAWRRLYHLYEFKRDEFLRHYHQRSNVESTFSAIKRKFGGSLRSKLPVAQMNETLLKCLCFNLSMLVHSIHELEIEPSFWQPKVQP